MIPLERQFQSIVLSILFGMFFMFIYSIFERIFRKSFFLIRLPFELFLFLCLSFLFFKLNVRVNEGLLHIYIPLFIVLGCFIYQKFYYKKVLRVFEKILTLFETKLINKIKLEFKKIYDIIKAKERVKKDAKKQQSRSESLESKQSRQYSYDWTFFNHYNDNH